MVNPGEAALNVVISDKRKMLIRLDQKVGGQVRVLLSQPTQMWYHRRIAATFPAPLLRRNVVSPLSSPPRTPRRKEGVSRETLMGQRVKEEGASECWPVMGRIGVEQEQHHPTRKRADFPLVLAHVNSQPTGVASRADMSAGSQ